MYFGRYARNSSASDGGASENVGSIGFAIHVCENLRMMSDTEGDDKNHGEDGEEAEAVEKRPCEEGVYREKRDNSTHQRNEQGLSSSSLFIEILN